MMNKRTKLNNYKRVRATRDALLKAENEGRQRRLVMELPNTASVHLITGWTSRCELELRDGYTIYHTGDDCLIKCGVDAYMQWLKNNCN